MADIERVGRLLAEMIARLDDDFLPNIREELMRPDQSANGRNSTKDDGA